MNEDIKSLIEKLRRGDYDEPTEKIGLLVAALREARAEVAFLTTLVSATQVSLRLAGVEACVGREEPELHQLIISCVQDREMRVRSKVAEALGSMPGKIAEASTRTLLADKDVEVRIAALRATAGKVAFIEAQQEALANDSNWAVRHAAAKALCEGDSFKIASSLMTALVNESDGDVREQCAQWLEWQLAKCANPTDLNLPGEVGLLIRAERQVKQLGDRFPKLMAWLQKRTTVAVDPEMLARFGTHLTTLAKSGLLPRAYGAAGACKSLLQLLQREPSRSIVVLGGAGVGKSALINELVYELAKPEHGGWQVLRMSPTDFMVGTKYTGEWETKVSQLVEAVSRPRRVIVYVPNLPDLGAMGRWEKSDANVATALAPYLEDGRVLLLGETTPEEFERGLGHMPSVQRLFDKLLVVETGREETLEILQAIRAEAKANLSDDVLVRLQELSDYFLSHLRRPGNAATLLRAVIGAQRESGREITNRDVLDALSRSSGVPAMLLDDQVPLNGEEVRAFFEQRVIGQPEAIKAVVDLVTLIKAGLTDPNKPFGVFLLVGPTGVGKTELARSLAEFIFGDVKRLLRFDMSEFSSPESYQRLIGGQGQNGLLTDAIRQQPCSVVLFDEIEKSHVNVFDLCLQIFDAGRLMDGKGRAVDFRRAIVLLTSNIGAQAPGMSMGFGGGEQPASGTGDADRTWRELTRFFRPEFLNRIDRIVHFNALSLEVTERIVRREVDLVLQRSGIVRRGLTVHVEPAVISLLVREGYSPHFGARPLKRTVEQRLLIPLAQTVAAGRAESNSVITVSADDGKISLKQLQKAPAAKTKSAPAVRPAIFNQAEEMRARLTELDARLQVLRDRKSALVAETSASGFYQDKARSAAVFDEIQKLDQFLELVAGLNRALSGIEHRIVTKTTAVAGEAALSQRLEALQADLAHAEAVAAGHEAVDFGDALVELTLLDREGEPVGGVEQLARMFKEFARRHRLAFEFLGERFDGKMDCAYCAVSGLGALSLFKEEAGLHKLDRRGRQAAKRNSHEKVTEDTEIIRVDVLPLGGEPDKKFLATVTSELRELRPARERLVERAVWQARLFHPPSVRSLEVWCGGKRAEALAQAMQVLHAQVSAATSPAHTEVVRHYQLGIGSRVKDSRSGRATTNVARVFKGHLELVRAVGGEL